jgi:CopG family nickel-responsive transcriptional regulator
MEIISLSLDEATLDKIGEIQEQTHFDGRSELVRTAIESLHQETHKLSDFENRLNALVVVRHNHTKEGAISDIAHQFEHIINTQLHSNLQNENCLEVFHVDGDAATIKEFYRTFKSSKSTAAVNILPQSS